MEREERCWRFRMLNSLSMRNSVPNEETILNIFFAHTIFVASFFENFLDSLHIAITYFEGSNIPLISTDVSATRVTTRRGENEEVSESISALTSKISFSGICERPNITCDWKKIRILKKDEQETEIEKGTKQRETETEREKERKKESKGQIERQKHLSVVFVWAVYGQPCLNGTATQHTQYVLRTPPHLLTT